MDSKHTFNGFYRGVVVDNNDPLKAGRVRVRVYPMFHHVLEEQLPWAIMSDPFMGGLNNVGGTFIPDVGAHVFVFFEAGDHRAPVYFGGAPAMEGGTPDLPAASRENGTYPHNKVYRTSNGIVVEFDNTSGSERVVIKHPSGTEMKIDSGGFTITDVGNTVIDADGNITINASGDVDLSASGNANVSASGNVVVTGTLIQLN